MFLLGYHGFVSVFAWFHLVLLAIHAKTCKITCLYVFLLGFAWVCLVLLGFAWFCLQNMQNHVFSRVLEPVADAPRRPCRASRDAQSSRRPLGSFRMLKTIVWQQLDAALTETWSYFGALVPVEKLDFWRPETHIWPTRPALARGIYTSARRGT